MSVICQFCHVRKRTSECRSVHCNYWMCTDCIRVCMVAECPLFVVVPDTYVIIKCPVCREQQSLVRLIPPVLQPGDADPPSHDAVRDYVERTAETKACRFTRRSADGNFWHACGDPVVMGRMVCPGHMAEVDKDAQKRSDAQFLCDQIEQLWK